MNKEKSRNLGPPDPFFLGEMDGWKKCGLIQPPRPNRVKGKKAKKNILKSASFDVMQTVFFAFTCKFGLVL